jgi:hypothetical protein
MNKSGINKMRSICELPFVVKLPIFFFSLYGLFGPFVNLAYHISKKGVGFENTLKYYFGNPDEMIPPLGLVSFLEVMHFHTWSQAAVIFILTILFSLTCFHEKLKAVVIVLTFISSLGHIFLPTLTRFVSKKFVYPLFLDTVLLSGCIIFISLSLIFEVVKRRKKNKEC